MTSKKKSYVMPTYGDKKIEFTRGKGCYLYDSNNEKYLEIGRAHV